MIDKILSSLDLGRGETQAYLRLLEIGPSTVGALAKKMGVARPSLYGFLTKLQEKGLVAQSLKYGTKTFSAVDPEKVGALFERKIKAMEKSYDQYLKMLPALKGRMGDGASEPKFRLYEGAAGVKQVMADLLLHRDIETLSFWPIRTMIEILSADLFNQHNRERIRNNIHVRAIWPQSQIVSIEKYPFLGTGSDFKREIRIAPPDADFSMGYWIYGDKVSFVSSRRESFGFIIESPELAEMMTTQHSLVWRLSKPLPPSDTPATRRFIREA